MATSPTSITNSFFLLLTAWTFSGDCLDVSGGFPAFQEHSSMLSPFLELPQVTFQSYCCFLLQMTLYSIVINSAQEIIPQHSIQRLFEITKLSNSSKFRHIGCNSFPLCQFHVLKRYLQTIFEGAGSKFCVSTSTN